MNFYPAIDIKDGQFIRLKKGKLSQITVYGNNPTNQAKEFVGLGAKWIHVVDIDGAFKGKSTNMKQILDIKRNVSCNIQVGGGIREIKTVDQLLNNNIDRIVLGTIALTKPSFVKEVCRKYPNKVAIGLDVRDDFVATEGWENSSTVKLQDMLKNYEDSGVSTVIYTDINRDGLMKGVNIDQLSEILKATNLNVIVSGGVSSLDDLREIKKIEDNNLDGVICGKAIYEKKFKVNEAIRILEK